MTSPQLPAGSVVAGYRILSLLGEGSTGAVYVVERDGERVALKVLGPEFARDERFRRRFIRESEIAAGLDHPNVVPILGFGEAAGELYLAMRHVDGPDLRALFTRDGALEPERALDLLAQVAGALDEAHARGLVHRDVKPANILVEGDHAYLADFGLAKHASSASSLTGERSFVGTIAYVAPEQVKGEKIDGRADVYSLGCVLHEALTGAPPFDRESELAVVYAHLNELPPRASDLRPELPEGMDRVLRKAMAKEPRQRYGSCAEAIEAARTALTSPRHAGRRRVLPVLAAVTAVAVVVAAVAIALGGGGGNGDEPAPSPQRLAVAGPGVALVDAGSRHVVGRIDLPERPADVVFGRGTAWALLSGAQRVSRIDIATRRATGGAGLPFAPGGIALAGGSVFVTESGGPGVVRIDAASGRVNARWAVDTHGFRVSDPAGIAAGAGSVWLARGAEVVRVDARSGRTVRRFPLPVTATLLAFAGGRLWAVSSENGLVEEIDPATNRIATRARLHGWVSALSIGGGSVWASVVPDDLVFRLSEDDASVEATRPAGRDPAALSTGPGSVWVANAAGRAITRLDMQTGARSETPVDGVPQLVRQHAGLLWVTASREPAVPLPAARGPEIRVALPDSQLFLDPAGITPPSTAQVLYATCAKLVNYPDAAGAPGRALRPEVAASMPAISAGGRKYTFRLRDGFRFSPPSGRPLGAADFKHSLERTLSPKSGPDPIGLHLLGDVVGARAFQAGRARSVTGIGASGGVLTITLTRPRGDLLARLAMPQFCAVPAGTPVGAKGPIPSAGPYYVRSQTAEQTVLERNPGYRGGRPRVPARITYLTGVPAAKAVALADGGRVDLVPWDYDVHGPLAPGGTLDRRFAAGGRYRVTPAPGVDMVAFNTKRPLFAHARLRRAVSHALDRRALAGVFDEAVTDRYVPAAVTGPPATHPYSLDPDLATARRLAGGRSHRRARLYFCGDPENVRVARLVRSNLRPLGIAVTIDQSQGCLRGPDPRARRADMILETRATADLDPAPFMRSLVGDTFLFGSGLGPVTWTDRAFSARLEKADALAGPARAAAFARLEDDVLRRDAPIAAFGSFTAPEYFSARTGCRLLQGAYNFADLGALCVRSG